MSRSESEAPAVPAAKASSSERLATHPVNRTMVKHYCALVEESRAAYWDPGAGQAFWGGEVSPPGMIMVWTMPLPWTPGGGRAEGLATLGGKLPGLGTAALNVSCESSRE